MHPAVAICIGASLGALVRWQLALWLNQGHALLPWGTLAANWAGGWLVGAAIALIEAQPHIDPAWRAAIVTGFLGALTTFSTFSAEAVGLMQQGRLLLAAAHAALHLFGSLALTWAGLRMAGAWLAR
jgi:CrcB protein